MNHARSIHHRKYLDQYLRNVEEGGLLNNRIKKELIEKAKTAALAGVKEVIEQTLEQELTIYLGLEKYQRGEVNRYPEQYRSGYYLKQLVTNHGIIDDIEVPKLRRGNSQIKWESVEKYQRVWKDMMDRYIMDYCLGMSLRDLQESFYPILGQILSLSAVNGIIYQLVSRIEQVKKGKIANPPPVLIVDGLWVKILYQTDQIKQDKLGRKRKKKKRSKRVILIAMGVWPAGHWEILHWKIAKGETTSEWEIFFEELYEKGVTEETTRLVVSDGAEGIQNGIDLCLYGVDHQRCVFHKIKNIQKYLTYGNLKLEKKVDKEGAEKEAKRERKKEILKDAGKIYKKAENKEEVITNAKAFEKKWEKVEPKAVENFLTDFDKTLKYWDINFPYLELIKTTNLLERFNREFRRKQKDIGCLQSEKGAEVLFFLVAVRENAKQKALMGIT